ncbi:MAG TPA: sensor histidine kinase [Bryobacteraceae bacterium]|jgi:signal transduction histidine kinase|nr:sensor histidine kinase [Bryobacteraceae bacterium]
MRALLRVLLIGFALVITMLIAAAIIGVDDADAIRASARSLMSSELVITRLQDEVDREQQVLNAAFYQLSRAPDQVDRDRILADLDQTDREIHRMVAAARGGPDEDAWNALERAVQDFSAEARQLLSRAKIPVHSSRDLFTLHQRVSVDVARLVDSSYARAVEINEAMDRQARRFVQDALLLFGGCLLVALISAGITVRIAARVFQQMEAQTSELSRVSFRMLETQESTARRFSHELHDELGGALTAIKTNLAALAASGADRKRIEDSIKLVDGAISNVRELSQLLRPTILDDFGLDAGIRWLTDRFRERTGIETDYRSEFTGRLADETETHLFRIVQEALTNIARHSGATQATIHLRAGPDTVHLTIHDNGQGLQPSKNGGGMGLIGMRARARSAGGELSIKSHPGAGVTIEVSAPRGKPVEK